MTLELYDPVTPSGAQAVMEWARLAHESVTGRDGYSDFYKKDIRLNILGPVGDVVGEWIVKGAYVKEANFGEYDWANEAYIAISLTIAMDYCILNYSSSLIYFKELSFWTAPFIFIYLYI